MTTEGSTQHEMGKKKEEQKGIGHTTWKLHQFLPHTHKSLSTPNKISSLSIPKRW